MEADRLKLEVEAAMIAQPIEVTLADLSIPFNIG